MKTPRPSKDRNDWSNILPSTVHRRSSLMYFRVLDSVIPFFQWVTANGERVPATEAIYRDNRLRDDAVSEVSSSPKMVAQILVLDVSA